MPVNYNVDELADSAKGGKNMGQASTAVLEKLNKHLCRKLQYKPTPSKFWSFSAGLEIPCLCYYPEVHHRLHKVLLLSNTYKTSNIQAKFLPNSYKYVSIKHEQ